MKDYKIEVWVTAICFFLVATTGGFLSAYYVIRHESYFDVIEVAELPEEERVELLDNLTATMGIEVAQRIESKGNFFVAKDNTIMGFPRHYFWLLIFSWIGATAIGAVWSIVMDRLEVRQRS